MNEAVVAHCKVLSRYLESLKKATIEFRISVLQGPSLWLSKLGEGGWGWKLKVNLTYCTRTKAYVAVQV